jgi:hypothetical protein
MVTEMEDPRCKIAAIEAEDPRCKHLLSGVVIQVEDPRYKSLYYRVTLEIEDPRCNVSVRSSHLDRVRVSNKCPLVSKRTPQEWV